MLVSRRKDYGKKAIVAFLSASVVGGGGLNCRLVGVFHVLKAFDPCGELAEILAIIASSCSQI